MTMTAEHSFVTRPSVGIPYKRDGQRMLWRSFARGAAMTAGFGAVFIWLVPGASWESDVMLFKLGGTIFCLYAAVVLWQASLPPLPPTVEIDTEKTELRLIRTNAAKETRVIERCSFAKLQTVELSGRSIAFWAPGGRLLAEITLSNATAHAKLLSALRAAGKLA